MAHNWWSVEYESAASGTTQQYKVKVWRFWKSRVVSHWLKHWWLKPVVQSSIPRRQLRLLHIFPLLFSSPRKFQSNYHFSLTFLQLLLYLPLPNKCSILLDHLNYSIVVKSWTYIGFINKIFFVITESDAHLVDYSSFSAKETKLQSL